MPRMTKTAYRSLTGNYQNARLIGDYAEEYRFGNILLSAELLTDHMPAQAIEDLKSRIDSIAKAAKAMKEDRRREQLVDRLKADKINMENALREWVNKTSKVNDENLASELICQLTWAEDVFQISARYEVASSILSWLAPDNATLEGLQETMRSLNARFTRAIDQARSETVRRACNLPFSTSVRHNYYDTHLMTAWARMLELLLGDSAYFF